MFLLWKENYFRIGTNWTGRKGHLLHMASHLDVYCFNPTTLHPTLHLLTQPMDLPGDRGGGDSLPPLLFPCPHAPHYSAPCNARLHFGAGREGWNCLPLGKARHLITALLPLQERPAWALPPPNIMEGRQLLLSMTQLTKILCLQDIDREMLRGA